MCSRDDIIELSDSDEDVIDSTSTAQSASTTESLRMDLIQRIIEMSDAELNSTDLFVLALQATKKESDPISEVPSKNQVKLEDVYVSWIKRENNSIEEVTVTTTTPLQLNAFVNSPPSSSGCEISEDTIAFSNKDDAIKTDPTFSNAVDSDASTEFEFSVNNLAVKLEPSRSVTIVDISATQKKPTTNTLKCSVKRQGAHDLHFTAVSSTSEDVRPQQNVSKRQCISTASTTSAAGPAPMLVAPMNNNTKDTANGNDEQIKCDVCGRDTTDLVHHYVKEHHSLVHVSQISAHFRKLMLSGKMNTTLSARKGQRYYQFCAFCEKKIDQTSTEWTEHLFMHTGEERKFVCKICNVIVMSKIEHQKMHGFESQQIVPLKTPIGGYLCNSCNYVQIFEINMIKHIKERHFVDEPELEKEYASIQLVCFRPNIRQQYSYVSSKSELNVNLRIV